MANTNSIDRPRSLRQALDQHMAGRVLRAARTVAPDGRFGDRKVFISAIWEALQVQDQLLVEGSTLESFKEWLLVQNRLGTLELARLDLTPALSPAQFAHNQASETRTGSATFHCLVVE